MYFELFIYIYIYYIQEIYYEKLIDDLGNLSNIE